MGLRFRKVRVFMMACVLMIISVVLLLNIMAVEMNASVDVREENAPIYNLKEDVIRDTRMKSRIINEFRVDVGAQVQRRPKTMDLEADENDNVDAEVDAADYDFNNDQRNLKTVEKVLNRGQNIGITVGLADSEKDNKIEAEYEEDEEVEELEDFVEEDEGEEEDIDEDEAEGDDYAYDDENPNPEFKPGDFGDIRGFEYYRKPELKIEDVPVDTHHDADEEAYNLIVQNKIFWSPIVEALVPKGRSFVNITRLVSSLRHQVVKTLEQPQWNKCGRPKNAFVILSDNTSMCARYRHPHDSFVYGEALSFHLSRILSMDNVPAVFLSTTNPTSQQWKGVNITSVQWNDNKTVALIQYVEDIVDLRSRVYIPHLLLQAYQSGQPVTASLIAKSRLLSNDSTQLSYLVQWGSMIIFDYLTGNYDRVASMQDAADKEKKPSIISEKIRNLRQSSNSRKMWLIDNESGFFDAYDLLTETNHMTQVVQRFVKFHRDMLHTMCVFQSSMVLALRKLASSPSPHLRLWNFATSFEPLLTRLSTDSRGFKKFSTLFPERLKEVLDWIDHCSQLSDR